MDKIKIAKFVTGLVVASGVTRIVNNVVRNNVVPATAWQKVTTLLGSLAIGGIVAGAAKKETDEIIDALVEGYRVGGRIVTQIFNRQ